MNQNKRHLKNIKAQTLIELSVFAAILIFMIGVILRQSLGYNYGQNQQLKATRLAFKQSLLYSEGLLGPGGFEGDPSRNSASVIFIEDRLAAGSGKYGSIDRSPQVINGAGTHSRNLFMPIDPGEDYAMPTIDFFVNGKQFPFTTAGLVEETFEDVELKTKIPNSTNPENVTGYDAACPFPGFECFNLDCAGGADVPGGLRSVFNWQWQPVTIAEINVDTGINTVIDVDDDCKEERLIAVNGSDGVKGVSDIEKELDQQAEAAQEAQDDGQPGIVVLERPVSSGHFIFMDFQEGDLDLTIGRGEDKPVNGLTDDIQVITISNEGTFFHIQEGDLFGDGNPNIRTTSKKNVFDVITRVVQLNKDTGRFCNGGTPWPTVGNVEGGLVNPVEVCASSIIECQGADGDIGLTTDEAGNTVVTGNAARTCMALGAPGGPLLFIRSRIRDARGRRWVTDRSGDENIEFVVPTQP